MTGIERAIKEAGGPTALGDLVGTTQQFIQSAKQKGYLPLERAKIASDAYGIPLIDLVRPDIADAMRRS